MRSRLQDIPYRPKRRVPMHPDFGSTVTPDDKNRLHTPGEDFRNQHRFKSKKGVKGTPEK